MNDVVKKTETYRTLEGKMQNLVKETERQLIPFDQLCNTDGDSDYERAKDVLARYAAAIAPNFKDWLEQAQKTAKSDIARSHLANNIALETGENHRSMLERFVAQVDATPNANHKKYVWDTAVYPLILASSESKIYELAVVAALEHTSCVFIPHLASYAKALGATDFEYTNKHGLADIAHANELLEALSDEAGLQPNWELGVSAAFDNTAKLLKTIFNPA